MNFRDNWRIVLLAVFVVASTFVLFVPIGGGGGASANATNSGPTTLRYGLQLSGGTRVRAPPVGLTAEGVSMQPDQQTAVVDTLVQELPNVSRSDVQVRFRGQNRADIEVFNGSVTRQAFANGLQAAGLDVTVDDVREGVTTETRQTMVRVINRKINLAGLSGGRAQVVTTATGGKYILVEVPNANRSAVIDKLSERGTVELVALYPTQQNGSTTYERSTVLTQDDFAGIQPAQQGQGQNPPNVPVTLTKPAADRFASTMQSKGFTSSDGIESCRYSANSNDPGYCLLTVTNGKVVYSASMGRGLARGIESGDFQKTRDFIITANNISQAQDLALNLRAGALPTTLAIQDKGTTFYLEPSLAGRFKLLSLVTGLVAALAVATTIFVRYGRIEVSVPMFLTAISEVYLLLGFAAAIGLALDLSHIAGFIAVIGTGVDDLVIIADEILQRGEIRTSRVFQSRFRKAFWVIGAAAATTIIAMSPLAVLSLGDLQGFAIVTIVGVLLGVLVTRPAYGDVLRNLVLADDDDD
ncbi:MAG: preprotein translocase subunit SecD [Haloarculaceae archaeon]